MLKQEVKTCCTKETPCSQNGHHTVLGCLLGGHGQGGQRDIWSVSSAGGDPVQITTAFSGLNPPGLPMESSFTFPVIAKHEPWRVPIDEATGKQRVSRNQSRLHLAGAGFSVFRRMENSWSTPHWTEINIQKLAFDPQTGTISDR
jgi:hypothetical protein